ncbi:hypothetical protein CBM2633_P380038 [Cupriavidus taiwanensis]|uniref:Uncharacterized protein n=2 Tax=Cupriavidus TaxID=106589 RepID=A0A375CRN8_9BURK|nr:hypothetical protein CBM2585_P380036 [Cupriavidus taiwanensis]SOZ40717.1 hypothetical protein CBM2605_P380038 [Cupriavidus neocaledonicus]SOY76638.1 hypothetical protein CBM2588_P420039 [Cupriavidus taiwanensis]SOY76690.1 hypothetical protein CBM2592_P400035 [Cupriavidus taiwanensis]SOY76997.1 hypothetical protein CBM2589_P380037 [Cupriavidus taiwanensis]
MRFLRPVERESAFRWIIIASGNPAKIRPRNTLALRVARAKTAGDYAVCRVRDFENNR